MAAAAAGAAGLVLAGTPVASAASGAGTDTGATSAANSAGSTAGSTVRHINVGGSPMAAVADPRRGAAWIATGPAVVRIREATQRIVATVKVGGADLVALDRPRGVVWTASQVRGYLAEISEQTNKVIRRCTLPVQGAVEGLAVDPRTATVWATQGPNLLEFSETSCRLLHTTVLTNFQFKAPMQVAVDAQRGLVWVVIQGDGSGATVDPGRLVSVSESTHRVVRSVLAGLDQAAIAIDQRAGSVLVASIQTVDVVSESTGRVRQLSRQPNNGVGIAVDPATGKIVLTGQPYASVGRIFVLGERTGKLLRTITGYAVPQYPAVDTGTGNVYVPISLRGSVTQFGI